VVGKKRRKKRKGNGKGTKKKEKREEKYDSLIGGSHLQLCIGYSKYE
jgi:hypothetical protein